MFKYIVLLSLATLLVACGGNATKSLTCTGNNWNELGYQTALEGNSVRTFDKYKEGCSNLEEQAMSNYLDGYTKGIIEYCSYDSGFKLGSNNVENSNVCPVELRADFDRGYRRGYAKRQTMLDKLDRKNEEIERSYREDPHEKEADEVEAY